MLFQIQLRLEAVSQSSEEVLSYCFRAVNVMSAMNVLMIVLGGLHLLLGSIELEQDESVRFDEFL